MGRRHGCVWWRAEGPVGASRDGVTWGMAVGGLEPELEPQERVGRASRLSSRSADGSLGALGRCESWVFPCSLVKVSRRRRAGTGLAGRSPAVKQVQVPACGGALPSLANLLDSSSTTCKGRTQLGSCPTGSKEPKPLDETMMPTPISDPFNCHGFRYRAALPWGTRRNSLARRGRCSAYTHDLVSQRRLTPRRDGRRLLFKRSHLDAAIEALS